MTLGKETPPTRRSVHVCDCYDLVFLGLQRLLDLGHSNSRAEIRAKLIDFSAVRLKAKPKSQLESTNSCKDCECMRTNQRSYHRNTRY